MSDYATLTPVNVLTGFLGSGKTTLLRRLLVEPDLRHTAVLINEFGEVGIDHHLVEHVSETTLLLDNGCVCCAIRDDLGKALRDLLSRSERGEIPAFSRLVIETSGLADPAPIAFTLHAEPVLQHHYRLATVLTTVDAVNGAGQLTEFSESVQQVAAADRIIITKSDIASSDQYRHLAGQLARINAAAELVDIARVDTQLAQLLTGDLYSPDSAQHEVRHWFARDLAAADAHAHTHGIESLCLTFDEPLDWTAFGLWMTMLLNHHGERVLRIKALLNIVGVAEPVLVDGAQHLVHPPTHLARWPNDDHRSRIVFIVRELAPERLRASLAAFNDLANPPAVSRVTANPAVAHAAAPNPNESRAPGSAAERSRSPAVPAG